MSSSSGHVKFFRDEGMIFLETLSDQFLATTSLWWSPNVGCSYMGCWEVVVNCPACIELLLLSGYIRRSVDSVGALLTEVQVSSCKAVYLDANETQNIWFGQCL